MSILSGKERNSNVEKKKYVIEKEGYEKTIVSLSENEVKTLDSFLDWACLDDSITITPVEEYIAEEWGA